MEGPLGACVNFTYNFLLRLCLDELILLKNNLCKRTTVPVKFKKVVTCENKVGLQVKSKHTQNIQISLKETRYQVHVCMP